MHIYVFYHYFYSNLYACFHCTRTCRYISSAACMSEAATLICTCDTPLESLLNESYDCIDYIDCIDSRVISFVAWIHYFSRIV